MGNTRRKGNIGESFVAEVLEGRGYEILARNYSTRFGELDIVAKKGDCVHFVEVKSRGSLDCGLPAEAVNHRKQQRIRRLAECWLSAHHMSGYTVSFDVAELEFRYIENCF